MGSVSYTHLDVYKRQRLHYAYPAHFPEELFRVMREHYNVCKYMDIALQHISDNMLNKMRRHVSKAETYELIEKFRREVPGIHSVSYTHLVSKLFLRLLQFDVYPF